MAPTRRLRLPQAVRAIPTVARVVAWSLLLLVALLGVNWAYQVVRKPTEILFPLSDRMYKTPTETWREYGTTFRANSTRVISADFLAALAQVEGAGNPLARTYWRWHWTLHPLQIYRPASSAVGMYQLTDGTFEEARHFCIRDHVVATDHPVGNEPGCWFNALYSRVLPSDAIEMTSAYLDRSVASILERRHRRGASIERQQALAAVIHLCGAGAADAFAARSFKFLPGQRCGDHAASAYVGRVRALQAVFRPLADGDT